MAGRSHCALHYTMNNIVVSASLIAYTVCVFLFQSRRRLVSGLALLPQESVNLIYGTWYLTVSTVL